jgi:hypothetical protein
MLYFSIEPVYGPAQRWFSTHFAVAPKVGDVVEVDEYTIRKLTNTELRKPLWKVWDVRHFLSLEGVPQGGAPVARFVVCVSPAK